MIYIKDGVLDNIKDWDQSSMYVLADFDRTLTLGSSSTSWSILSKSDMVPKEYVSERQELYDFYRPIEIDEKLDYDTKNRLMKEWWTKHISLFIKYKISEEVVKRACRDLRVMSFREGAKDFLRRMFDNNIPVIIISAGIGNFIKEFLVMNDCDYDNIFVVSNFIKFSDGVASGIADNIIHSLNKNEVSMPENIRELIKNRENIILLGDGISDVRMASEEKRSKALKIGFLEEKVEENMESYRSVFDVVCTENTSFEEISRKLLI